MARIRSLKPDLWLSPQVMNLELGARLLFIGLITQADDQGRGVADPRRLKAAVLPADDVTAVQVDGWVSAIEAEGLAILYTVDSHGRLYQLPSWHTHQSINKPKPSNYPPPPGYESDCDGINTGSGRDESRGIGGEGKGKEGKGDALARATVGLNLASWDAWIEYRRSIGKPLKPASMEEAAKKLAAFGADQDAVVRQSIGNGWQGLFPLKDVPHGTSGRAQSANDRQAAIDLAWSRQKARANAIGFRMPLAGEALDNYRAAIDRETPDNRRGPQSAAALMPQLARPS